jgi:hypothetical protein
MSSTNKQSQQQTVLPMRFYANWDVDRTSSPIAVQRWVSDIGKMYRRHAIHLQNSVNDVYTAGALKDFGQRWKHSDYNCRETSGLFFFKPDL